MIGQFAFFRFLGFRIDKFTCTIFFNAPVQGNILSINISKASYFNDRIFIYFVGHLHSSCNSSHQIFTVAFRNNFCFTDCTVCKSRCHWQIL